MENSEEIGGRLAALIEGLVRGMRELSAHDELSSSWASALGLLDTSDMLSVSDLARRQGVSQPAMTQLLDRMASDGLVERAAPGADRRLTRIHLTEAGRAALTTRRTRRADRVTGQLERLTAEERAALARALPALETLVSLMGPSAAPVPAPSTNHPEKEEKPR